ncbi:MAG: glycosyltransferase [Gemmatimonadota bacterium]|nr:glycosyltransferase [Gemmatimonadota bacterium]
MTTLALLFIAAPVACGVYAYALYPLVLRALAARRPAVQLASDPDTWPLITISIPAYNEQAAIREAIESVLAADYPADRRQLLILSDASSDGTDAIVGEYAARGVELFRLAARGGKTAAENAAAVAMRGDIVVNTDASIRILPHSLKALVRAFSDATVGVASGRDISVGEASEANRSESTYVGYEMWVRQLETRLGSIVGASGCLYAYRRPLHDPTLPVEMTRDFAAPMQARALGLRSVSIDDAVCIVPRTKTLRAELRRKARTMGQGLQTLWYQRSLMNPARYGGFALMLVSHKLARWLVYPAGVLAIVGLVILAPEHAAARWLLVLGALGAFTGTLALRWPSDRTPPFALALAGYALSTALAGVLAWARLLRRQRVATWEPTRRDTASASAGSGSPPATPK